MKLIQQLHEAANRLSYYNAAEGDWSRERDARGRAQAEYYRIRKEVEDAGIDVSAELAGKGYLL
jgi:hypothetical protein